ncbi:phosphotransferase family protein [Nocardia sp. NPDC052278]|uniref:phosphotransferase family protein n=1 Tax=unclassified Nocardia TaxID=2637762 RepID=UPI00368E4EEE
MSPLVSSIEDVTPEWLTATLRAGGVLDHGGSIEALDTMRVGSGQLGSAFLVRPKYTGTAPGAPDEFVVKLPATDPASRAYARSVGCYEREVRFYQQLASDLPVRVPRCYHAEVSEDKDSFCLLLESLAPTTSFDQLTGCDLDSARTALGAAAGLHAGTWRNPALRDIDWLSSGLDVWQQFGAAAPQAQQVFRDRYGSMLDDAAHEVAARLEQGYAARWADTLREPRCLWHCDFRLDNLLFHGKAGQVPITVVDWQSVTLAPGPIDASYFIGASLDIDVRRDSEIALLRHYHQSLNAYGVQDYSWEQCYDEYRINTLCGFLVAMVASIGVVRSDHADRLFTTMANRHAAHILDNNAFEYLDALAGA